MPHTWQKPCGKLLCIDLNLGQNVSELKFKPISNYTKRKEVFVVSCTKKKGENIMRR